MTDADSIPSLAFFRVSRAHVSFKPVPVSPSRTSLDALASTKVFETGVAPNDV